MNFKDKIAVITGAASGIGKATAQAFAKHGAAVVLADKNAEKGLLVAEQLTSQGYNTIFSQVDIADKDAVDNMIREAVKSFGSIDFLVNNAGIEYNNIGNLVTMPYEKLDEILRVNLYGSINCIRSAVPHTNPGGCIVNVSSVQGLAAHLPGTSYQVSKAGLLGLTKALAVELAPDIRVNAICPGAIATEGMGNMEAEHLEIVNAYRKTIPLGRRGHPQEVAGPILFLCSSYANYITGEVIVVDGGYMSDITPNEIKPKKNILKNDPDIK